MGKRRTMYMGYYFEEGVKVGYNIKSGGLTFHNVAYHSKGELKRALVAYGHDKDKIEEERIENYYG